MLTDIQIAQRAEKVNIKEIARKINLTEEDIEQYGADKAKITHETILRLNQKPDGKLVLVTSINPTPAGEGKSTVSVGLADALNRIGETAVLALREPSMGPTMGMKGGATGGGYAQVVPMEDINLHFTGDFHALTSANNALSAFIDNHIYQGNALTINPTTVTWKRVVDLNDRSLRNVVVGLGGRTNGVPREDGFDITVASELMAILCLAKDVKDLKERLKRIVIAETYDKKTVTVADLKVQGALALLLKDAIKPNLVQTLEHTPALIHGGPFANIAHGCNSVLATKTALKLGDYTVTEAGFGADLGAEKFLDIKVPILDKTPDVVVIVATIRALKMHGGVPVKELAAENIEALGAGFANLEKHIENIQAYRLPVVVAINEFTGDTSEEITHLTKWLAEKKISTALTSVWENGSVGGVDLAEKVVAAAQKEVEEFLPLYDTSSSMTDKIEAIVTKTYGGSTVYYTKKAANQLKKYKRLGWDTLPICMAKTQYSLSDDPKKLGRPTDFAITIREFVPKLGAGFIVALTGDVLTMPGLPKEPAALKMDIKEDGEITGLF